MPQANNSTVGKYKKVSLKKLCYQKFRAFHHNVLTSNLNDHVMRGKERQGILRPAMETDNSHGEIS